MILSRPWLHAWLITGFLLSGTSQAQTRCEVVPLADQQTAFSIDGVEKLRWHYGDNYPRPYFFPFYGPSGAMLTRMGHPGAPDHDHHQSIWFAHNKLQGQNFWGNGTGAHVRQKQWLAYQNGDHEAVMAVLLGWYDPEGVELMEQELIAAVLPIAAAAEKQANEHALELQFTLRPVGEGQTVELEQTNFGFLAVRVAQGISAHFGGGVLTNSEGGVSEKECFGLPARWMDYSGPVTTGTGTNRITQTEGITFFDHPANPRYPTHWHVRQDGWMGAAYGLAEGAEVTPQQPLTLRYLLHAHHGPYAAERAQMVAEQFSARPGFEITTKPRPHLSYGVHRSGK